MPPCLNTYATMINTNDNNSPNDSSTAATASIAAAEEAPPHHHAKPTEEDEDTSHDDRTADLSDTSFSHLGNSLSSRRDSDNSDVQQQHQASGTSIMRVATLEESLAELDLSAVSDEEDENNNSNPKLEEKSVLSNSNPNDSQDDNGSTNHVSFSQVEVREYAVALGDNPAVLNGAPLTLEWTAQSEAALDLDAYETSRPDRRHSDQLRIPSFVRDQMLRTSGYSRQDIQQGVKNVNILRQKRRRTNETHRLHKAQELAQRVVKGVANKTTRRQRHNEETELLNHFRQAAAAQRLEQLQATSQHQKQRRATWAPTPAKVQQKRRGTWAPTPNSAVAAAAVEVEE